MSIASEIARLQGVKSDILQSIADKGVTIPTGSALADCPTLIASITGGGGGSELDLFFSRPVFAKQMTIPTAEQRSTYVYDARLDILFKKIPPAYEQHRYLRNTKGLRGNEIDTGIIAEELDKDIDIDIVTCIYINEWKQYAKMIGNDYISNDDHYFAFCCGGTVNSVNAFVNSGYNDSIDYSYYNAEAILLRQDYTNYIRYGGTITRSNYNSDYMSGSTSGRRNNSTIKIFSSVLCTIYYVLIRKAGVVVMDLVPCKRISDGVSGFYDKVSDRFLTNTDGDGLIAED